MSRRKAHRKLITQKAKEKNHLPQAKVFSSRRRILIALISLFLIAATLAVFGQIGNHPFLDLDDNAYVTENPHVQSGLTLAGVTWAFTTTHAGLWIPLTWLSHMLDCQLYGLNPRGHHLTSLAFHIASALLLFFVFERMTGALWRSAFVAALFALHPLHVESVAWVAERKDVFSTFFWMLTMWTYIRYVEQPRFNRYLLVLLFFALGLLSKPMLATLPFVLLLLDYWPLGRFQFGRLSAARKPHTSKPLDTGDQESNALRLIREKAPFFVLCAICSILTIIAAQKTGAVAPLEGYTLGSRIANALVSYVRYIEKMVWPRHLAILYPVEILPIWKVLGSCLLLACVSLLVIRAARKLPYLVVGWFWYLGTLIPVIGIVQAGLQALADRFTYVPMIGLFVMIAWGIPDILVRWRFRKVVLSLSTGLLLLLLMIVTNFQLKYWQNDITVFEHTLAVTSNNFTIHTSLGTVLAAQGKTQEAIAHYVEALRIYPDYAEAHNNLGLALARQGKTQEAIAHYVEALRIKPYLAEAHSNLGIALAAQGKTQEADAHYAEALRIKPDSAEAQNSIGAALAGQGKIHEAIVHYTEALRIKPDFAEAHNNLGVALAAQGKTQEAVAHYAEALRIKPYFAEAHNNLGVALAAQGKTQEAIAHYTEALRIRPDYAEAHYNQGVLVAQQGKIEEAIAHYTEALRIKPDYVEAHNNLGVALAAQGKTQEAIAHYTEALRIKPDFAEAHYNLGLAVAQQGKIQEAIAHYTEAVRIKPDYADAHINLGLAYLTIGHKNSALEEYKILKKINPHLANILYGKIFK